MARKGQRSEERRKRQSETRRRFMAAVLAAGAGATAGCLGGGDGDSTATDASTSTSASASETTGMQDTTAQSVGTDTQATTAASNGTATQSQTTPEGEPVATTLAQTIATVPSQSQVNRYSPTSNIFNLGVAYMYEIPLPFRSSTKEFFPSGHTWNIDGEEISVATWLEDWEISPPYHVTESYDDRITYWDGTDMDAEAMYQHAMINHLEAYGAFTPGGINAEVVDKWTYRHWQPNGEAEGESDIPLNRFKLRNNVAMYEPPPHPDFTGPWVERLQGASSRDELDSLFGDLQNDTISFGRLAEEGWGSGLYRIESTDDITSDAITLQQRDDHPNSQHAEIPTLELAVATSNRVQILANQGNLDLGFGIIQEDSGTYNRSSLPDYIQQKAAFAGTAEQGFVYNWGNRHLSRLWVRRAIAAAIDWPTIAYNAYGERAVEMTEYQTGLPDAVAENWFSQEFLDSLHTYPMRADRELAREYMQRAGYSREGGTWVGPDGNQASIQLDAITAWGPTYTLAAKSMKVALEDFGFRTSYEGLAAQAYTQSRKFINYDMTFFYSNVTTPFEFYQSSPGWWAAKLVGKDPDFPNSEGYPPRVDAEDMEMPGEGPDQQHDTVDQRGMPIQGMPIPDEVGSIAAPDQAGAKPSLDNATTIDLADVLAQLRGPGLTEERAKELTRQCARFYNFYLPDWWMATSQSGQWANVRDFSFAEEDHPSYSVSARLGGQVVEYNILSGLPMLAYDEEYPEPGGYFE